jgi:hypothetical protein
MERENLCHVGKILKRNFGDDYIMYIFQWLKLGANSEILT